MKNSKSYLFIAMLSLVTAVACGKKDEAGPAAVPAAAVTYVVQNGQCYQSGTATVVEPTLCPQTTNGGYYVSGNQCLQTGTNIVVGPAPCPLQTGWQNGGWQGTPGQMPPGYWNQPPGYYPGVGGNIGVSVGIGPIGINIGGSIGGSIGGGGDLTCRGWFFQPGVGWGICNGFNCHGLVMYSQNGPVYCP